MSDLQDFDGPYLEAEDDRELAEYQARVDREIAAGCGAGEISESPDLEEPWELEDLVLGSMTSPRFGQGEAADVLPPGPVLAGLTEQAVRQAGELSDDALVGAIQATDRQIAREHYKKVVLVAEFGRRRQTAFEDARARGVPEGCRPGGFPGEELAAELVITRVTAGHLIEDAIDLTSRLPRTLAAMAAGQVDLDRAEWITFYTRGLSEADAALADEVLAAAAPELRTDQLARKAAALEKKLAPEVVRARKERSRRENQRVEARREASGNASLSGREMDTAEVMASKAHIDAVAAQLRAGGVPGRLETLRVMALADLTQGRNPLDRLSPRADPACTGPTDPEEADCETGPSVADPDTWPGWGTGPDDDPEDLDGGDPDPDPDPSGHDSGWPARTPPAPMPALINLTVPVGTLLGWSNAPAQAGAWGLLDRAETRTIVGAAAQHSRTRWCVTLTAPDGTALAHGCARGQHPDLLDQLDDADPAPPARLAELLRGLNVSFTPLARGSCITPRPRTATRPAGCSSTSFVPAPRPATLPAATPSPLTPTSTTRLRGPMVRPISATSRRGVVPTTVRSRHPTGGSSSSSPGSAGGPCPRGERTPQGRPGTTPNEASAGSGSRRPAAAGCVSS